MNQNEQDKPEHKIADAKTKADENVNRKTDKDQKEIGDQEISKQPERPSKEVKEKIEKIKVQIEKFRKRVDDKFGKYLVGMSLLPPSKDPKHKDKINLIVLMDDSDSIKPSKEEVKFKLDKVIRKMADQIDKNIVPEIATLSEFWQSCYDSNYELISMIGISTIIQDNGLMTNIKMAELHKQMVLKKFEKYIVSYVIAGPITSGEVTDTIPSLIIIDDTDVKKMTRYELKEKLHAIIIGMGLEAGQILNTKTRLSTQVFILTEVWDSIKEANPVIYNILREGVPLFDRGIFMPWKQLLKMGKVKPSAEAIDILLHSGEQLVSRVKTKMKEIMFDDLYYAVINSSQAALMLQEVPPCAPKDLPKLMKNTFLKKKMLDEKTIKRLKDLMSAREDIEKGKTKDISGKDIDKMLDETKAYIGSIKKLFGELDLMKAKSGIVEMYDTAITAAREILETEKITGIEEKEIEKSIEKELVQKGKIPEAVLRSFRKLKKAREDHESGKLNKAEIEAAHKEARQFLRFISDYIHNKRGLRLKRAKLKVRHKEKTGEVIMLDNEAFIIEDINAENTNIKRAVIRDGGSFDSPVDTSYAELDEAIAKVKMPKQVFITEKVLNDLKTIFKEEVEILL